MAPFLKCSWPLLLIMSMPHCSRPGIPKMRSSISSATTALILILFPRYEVFIVVSHLMVREVAPSPSLALVMFVGDMGRPIFLHRAVLAAHAEVHPVSRMRSSLEDSDLSWSLVITTDSDGDGQHLTLLL